MRLKTLKQGQTSLAFKLNPSRKREGSYVEKTRTENVLETLVSSPFIHLVCRLAQAIFIEAPSFVLVLTTGLSVNILHLVHRALQESRPAGVEL